MIGSLPLAQDVIHYPRLPTFILLAIPIPIHNQPVKVNIVETWQNKSSISIVNPIAELKRFI